MFSISRCGPVGMLVFVTTVAAAQDTVVPPITVSNSRLQPESAVGSAIDRRIYRAEIEREAVPNALSLLRDMPGVDAAPAGGEGGLSFVSIHGGDPNFTLFMLDGVKLNDPTNSRGGGVDLYLIPLAMIDRVEVSTQPASAILGSDGLSGSVSFTSRAITGTHLQLELADNGSASGSLAAGTGDAQDVEASVVVGGTDKTSGAKNDRLHQRYFFGKAAIEPTEHLSVDLLLYLVDGTATSFPEDSGGDRLAVIRDPEKRDYRREVVGVQGALEINDRLSLHSAISWTSHEEDTDNPGIAPGVLAGVPAVSGERTYERTEGQVYVLARPSDMLSVTLGAAYDEEKGTSEDLIDFGGFIMPADFELTRSTTSVFAEAAVRPLPVLTLQAGVRRDMPDSADDESTFSVAASYDVARYALTLFSHYAEGFKLPSMFALGHPLVGNPDLTPEYSEAFDVGARKRWPDAGVELGVSVFRNKYRDLVDFDPVLFTNVNRGLVEVDGGEIQLDWLASDEVAIMLQATYSDADIVSSDDVLRRRPLWKGGAGVQWTPSSRLVWSMNADYTGSFFDSSVPTGLVRMPAYWNLRTAVGWQVSDDVRLRLSVDNLLDDDYEQSVGFSNGGRSARIDMRVSI